MQSGSSPSGCFPLFLPFCRETARFMRPHRGRGSRAVRQKNAPLENNRRGRCTPRALVPLRSTAPTSSHSIYGKFPMGYSVPPGTVHFSQQLEKCIKEPGEPKVSLLPGALYLIRIRDPVPHVRRGRSLSRRIKGLSHAAAPLPLMPRHGRGAFFYYAAAAEPRPYAFAGSSCERSSRRRWFSGSSATAAAADTARGAMGRDIQKYRVSSAM